MFQTTVSSDLFTVNVVVNSNETISSVQSLSSQIDTISNPREILTLLETINGVVSVEIFDVSSDTLLLSSSPLTE